MADREIIIRSLVKTERRIRANRLFRELTFALSVVLILLLVFKVWDLFSALQGATVGIAIAVCLTSFAVYSVWRLLRKGKLDEIAASIDTKARLHDELKTAFWFINNPRCSEWVDALIERAANRATGLDISYLYPRRIPKEAYLAASMIILFGTLNFLPVSGNHNWLALQALPSSVADQEAIQNQAESFAQKAGAAKQSDLARRVQELMQQLQEGKIDSMQAAALLKKLEEQLKEALGEMQKAAERTEVSLDQSNDNPSSGVGDLPNAERDLSGLNDEDQENAAADASPIAIQLEQQSLTSAQDEDDKAEEIEPSKWAQSKLDYRSVKAEVNNAEKDLMNQNRIPWAYRPLIKHYFQAIHSPDGNN